MSKSYFPSEWAVQDITNKATKAAAGIFNETGDSEAFSIDPTMWLWAMTYIGDLEQKITDRAKTTEIDFNVALFSQQEASIEELQAELSKSDAENATLAQQVAKLEREALFYQKDAEDADRDRNDMVRIVREYEGQQ